MGAEARAGLQLRELLLRPAAGRALAALPCLGERWLKGPVISL